MDSDRLVVVALSIALVLLSLPYLLEEPSRIVLMPGDTPMVPISSPPPTATLTSPPSMIEQPPVTSPTVDPQEKVYAQERDLLVTETVERRGVRNPTTLAAMRSVLRHRFMPEDVRDYAYEDRPVPIGHGQTISQPYIVALMTEEMWLKGDEKVLEIGTGSGYQAAVLAEIVPEVYSIEIIDTLAERAQATLRKEGYDNVHVLNADGYDGWAEHAPYDAIIITCAVDHVPPPLVAQLAEGGRIVLPLGDPRLYQTLTVVEKEDGKVTSRHVLDVRFVPMTGRARD